MAPMGASVRNIKSPNQQDVRPLQRAGSDYFPTKVSLRGPLQAKTEFADPGSPRFGSLPTKGIVAPIESKNKGKLESAQREDCILLVQNT